jgi:hypothetical protein
MPKNKPRKQRLATGHSVAQLVNAASMSAPEHRSTSWNIPPMWSFSLSCGDARYKLSLRDLAEMFLERGWEFSYEAVREWEEQFAPLITEQLRTKRRGQAGGSWYVDETYGHASKGNGVICIVRSITMVVSLIRC